MIKVLIGLVRHAQLFHHTPGSEIGWNCKRDKGFKSQVFKGVVNDCTCAFGCKPLSPEICRESPADFDARSECGFEGWDRQTDKANEAAVATQFRCIKPKPVLPKMGFDAICQPVALGS